ncbi:hypothetical protein RvY_02158 [Ramazzottius varieornatus]|uniref:Uncharacterized protein n=1 Tax=Ramazzottius varieornatus TaxID=947166 RepID=A0A1D1UTW8_RAMVA|nr:hypothetical protein RvY_02158 [Ramazzottius varieornatus]
MSSVIPISQNVCRVIPSVTTPASVGRRQTARFPTWLSTGVTTTLVPYVKLYNNLMVRLGWSTAVIVADIGGNPFIEQVARVVFQELIFSKGYQIDYLSLNSSTASAEDLSRLLKTVQHTLQSSGAALRAL